MKLLWLQLQRGKTPIRRLSRQATPIQVRMVALLTLSDSDTKFQLDGGAAMA